MTASPSAMKASTVAAEQGDGQPEQGCEQDEREQMLAGQQQGEIVDGESRHQCIAQFHAFARERTRRSAALSRNPHEGVPYRHEAEGEDAGDQRHEQEHAQRRAEHPADHAAAAHDYDGMGHGEEHQRHHQHEHQIEEQLSRRPQHVGPLAQDRTQHTAHRQSEQEQQCRAVVFPEG